MAKKNILNGNQNSSTLSAPSVKLESPRSNRKDSFNAERPIYTSAETPMSVDNLDVALNRYTLTSYSIFGFVWAVKNLVQNDFHQYPHVLIALINEYLSRVSNLFIKKSGNSSKLIIQSYFKIQLPNYVTPQSLIENRLDLPNYGSVELCQFIFNMDYCIDKVKMFEDIRSFILLHLHDILFKSPATKFKDDMILKRIENYSWVKPDNLDFKCNEVY